MSMPASVASLKEPCITSSLSMGFVGRFGRSAALGCRVPPGNCMMSSARDELLAAVDVVGGAGERGVDHDVHGECGNVPGTDDAPDGQRVAELLAALFKVVAQRPYPRSRVAGPYRVRFQRARRCRSCRPPWI